MYTEIQPLEYQLSATLSPSTAKVMEFICEQVLLQKSVSVVDEETEPLPSMRPSKQYQYAKLPLGEHKLHNIAPRKFNNRPNKRASKHDLISSDSTTIDLNRLPSITHFNQPYHKKWHQLWTNFYFWNRFIVSIFTLIVFSVSCAYCIGQLIEVKIEAIDFKPCPEPLGNDNSYISIFKETHEISDSGHSDNMCWTMAEMEESYVSNENTITYDYEWKYIFGMNIECMLFGGVAVYALIIILYNLITMIRDILYIKQNKLHTKSELFIESVQEIRIKQYNVCCSFYKQMDWILLFLCSEIIAFMLQSIALLFYNGYHVLDTNESYLAEKASLIILFVIIICLNAFICGILWLSYCLASPQYCQYGTVKSLLYFIDIICDIFYVLFPVIIIADNINNNHNENAYNILLLFGEIDINCNLMLFAIFIPLFLACNKCLFMSVYSMKKMRNDFYKQWKRTQPQTIPISEPKSNKISKILTETTDTTEICQIGWRKRLFLFIISISFVLYGLYVFTSVLSYFHVTQAFCDCITEKKLKSMNGTLTNEQIVLLQTNPELIFYDKCSYKVYPFTFDSNNHNKCECRSFIIDWTDINMDYNGYINKFTQNDLLNAMLSHWNLLETFRSCFVENEFINCTLNKFIDDECDQQCNSQYCNAYNLSSNFMVQSVVIFENETMPFFEGNIFQCLH